MSRARTALRSSLLLLVLVVPASAEQGDPNLMVIPDAKLPVNGRILLFSVNGLMSMGGALRGGLALEAGGERVPLRIVDSNLLDPDRKGYGNSLWVLAPGRPLRVGVRYALKARAGREGWQGVNRFGPLGRENPVGDPEPRLSWLTVAADRSAPRIAAAPRVAEADADRSTVVRIPFVDASPVLVVARLTPGTALWPVAPDSAAYTIYGEREDAPRVAFCLEGEVSAGKRQLEAHVLDLAGRPSATRALNLVLKRGTIRICAQPAGEP